MYPLLSDFAGAVTSLLAAGSRKVLLDLSHGDLRGQRHDRLPDGSLPPGHGGRRRAKLAGVQKRVETMLTMTGAQNFLEIHADEAERRQELRELSDMRTIKTTTGREIVLDGDLLAVMEALYHEVTAKRELERSFEDMVTEINHLIEQMTTDERRAYLAESLFLNTVKYENDKLEGYMRKLEKK